MEAIVFLFVRQLRSSQRIRFQTITFYRCRCSCAFVSLTNLLQVRFNLWEQSAATAEACHGTFVVSTSTSIHSRTVLPKEPSEWLAP